MLKLENISFAINNHQILDGLCLLLKKGEFVALTGANGSGKSMLFSCITGRRHPNQGNIILDECDISQLSQRERAMFIAELRQDPKIGSVAEMTVWENLCLSNLRRQKARLRHYRQSLSIERLRSLFVEISVDVERLLSRKMSELSGGQRQMVNFIMAVLDPPRLLLLDEPTAALDPQAASNLLLAVAHYVRKHHVGCLMITHDCSEVEALADRFVHLRNGKLFENNCKILGGWVKKL